MYGRLYAETLMRKQRHRKTPRKETELTVRWEEDPKTQRNPKNPVGFQKTQKTQRNPKKAMDKDKDKDKDKDIKKKISLT